jgi:signal transduction histidine kinase
MAGWRRLRGADAVPAALMLLGMALFVTAVYVVVVRAGGALIGRTDSPSLVLSVLATAIVALGFQPVRRRLQPVAVRLARRERSAPYEVLTRFLDEVAGGYAADNLPDRMARLLASATEARYVQVWLEVDGRPRLAATWPAGADADETSPPDLAAEPGRRVLPVRHGAELLGILVVRERDRQPLTPLEEQLFAGLAAQAGLVLRAVRLRAELAVRLRERTQRAEDLRASQARIVAAEAEERRRLERDIHDGAQQHLVALAVNLRLARTLVARSPDRAPAVLKALGSGADDAIATLADLSRGIYPRVLSERGLYAALEAAVATSSVPATLTVAGTARPPAEAEAALYFCGVEALQNAAKHAGATRVAVRVGSTGAGMELVVSDDGHGFPPDVVAARGGLANIRDRAEAVGGVFRVDSRPGHGAVVTVRIPTAGGGG